MTLRLGNTLIAGYNTLGDLNNPFSLLDYKYSEYELDNASWLRSNGQYNSGSTYSAVYNLLLAIYNGTETKAGVSVKLSTETYDDTDFVLNTGDTTFRLPTVVKLASGKAVVGDGATSPAFYTAGTSTLGGLYSNNGTLITGTTTGNQLLTTDETKSGMETSANGLYLYFYVGDTVQDANVLAAGQALSDIANLKAHYVTETYTNGTSGYRVWSDGYCEQWGRSTVNTTDTDIVFLKEFANTDYTININQMYGWTQNPGGYDMAIMSNPQTTKVVARASTGPLGSIWKACGYIS